jgi:hypothetical protein
MFVVSSFFCLCSKRCEIEIYDYGGKTTIFEKYKKTFFGSFQGHETICVKIIIPGKICNIFATKLNIKSLKNT